MLVDAIEHDVKGLFQLAKQEILHVSIRAFKDFWIRHDYGMLFTVRLPNVSNYQVRQVFQRCIQRIVLEDQEQREIFTSQIAMLFLFFMYYTQPMDRVLYPVYYTSDFVEALQSWEDPIISQLLDIMKSDNALVWNQWNTPTCLDAASDADNWYRKSKIKKIEQAIANDPLLVDPLLLELCQKSDKSCNDNVSLHNLLIKYRQSLS